MSDHTKLLTISSEPKLENHLLSALAFRLRDNQMEDCMPEYDDMPGACRSIPPVLSWGGLNHITEPAVAIAALKVTKDIWVEWLKYRANHKVSITIAGRKVEIHGSNDVDECIKVLEAMPAPPATEQTPERVKKTTSSSKRSKG